MSVLTGKNITQLAMGGSEQVDSHTLAIVEPGKLYATGDNTYGQLVRAAGSLSRLGCTLKCRRADS